jgi:pimeloyl-ACP methyl ester carboxylesterase
MADFKSPPIPERMPSAWKYNKSVAPALIYDLTVLDDKSVLTDRAKDITVPTLVVGGAKSPSDLQIAVKEVAAALPNAKARFLEGQTHNVSAKATVPVLESFFTSTAN